MCVKRAYTTEKEARSAHRRAGWRLRIYRCPVCRKFHVASAEKANYEK